MAFLKGLILRWQAERCRVQKDYPLAARLYVEAIDSSGKTPFDWAMVAQCRELAGDHDGALRAAERALALDADTFTALQTAAKVLVARGDHRAARLCVERGLLCVPELSGGFVRFLRLFSKVLRAMRAIPWIGSRINQEAIQGLEHPEHHFKSWEAWAQDYQVWYREQYIGTDDKHIH